MEGANELFLGFNLGAFVYVVFIEWVTDAEHCC